MGRSVASVSLSLSLSLSSWRRREEKRGREQRSAKNRTPTLSFISSSVIRSIVVVAGSSVRVPLWLVLLLPHLHHHLLLLLLLLLLPPTPPFSWLRYFSSGQKLFLCRRSSFVVRRLLEIRPSTATKTKEKQDATTASLSLSLSAVFLDFSAFEFPHVRIANARVALPILIEYNLA